MSEAYGVLLHCPNLRTLRVKCEGLSTLRHALDENYTDPNPLISPFFLEALCSILSRSTPALPHLETLAFHFFSAPIESLALCSGAWAALARTLGSTDRYPHFRCLAIEFEEMMVYGGKQDCGEYNPDERTTFAKGMFYCFEEAGVRVDVSTRQCRWSIG